MQIRSLSNLDLPALLSFYTCLPESVTCTFRPFGPVVTEATIKDHLDGADDGRHISLGLFAEDGKICGHSFIWNVGSDAPVFGIGLAECAQGKGLGREIMTRVLAEADALGAKTVSLTVVKTNERAWRLYESLGFRVTGEATFLSENDSFCMVRDLVEHKLNNMARLEGLEPPTL